MDANNALGTPDESDELTKKLVDVLVGTNAMTGMGALTRVVAAIVRMMNDDNDPLGDIVTRALVCTHILCILDTCDMVGIPSGEVIKTIEEVRANKRGDTDGC